MRVVEVDYSTLLKRVWIILLLLMTAMLNAGVNIGRAASAGRWTSHVLVAAGPTCSWRYSVHARSCRGCYLHDTSEQSELVACHFPGKFVYAGDMAGEDSDDLQECLREGG